MARGLVERFLTIKMVAAAVAVTAAGGFAVAASTGALPLPGGSGEKVAGTIATRGTGEPSDPPRTAGPSAVPSPVPAALVELCRAYAAGGQGDPGEELVAAAGGKDEVDGYCEGVLEAEPGAEPTTTSAEGGGAAGVYGGASPGVSVPPAVAPPATLAPTAEPGLPLLPSVTLGHTLPPTVLPGLPLPTTTGSGLPLVPGTLPLSVPAPLGGSLPVGAVGVG
jgi:hypothetical protein